MCDEERESNRADLFAHLFAGVFRVLLGLLSVLDLFRLPRDYHRNNDRRPEQTGAKRTAPSGAPVVGSGPSLRDPFINARLI